MRFVPALLSMLISLRWDFWHFRFMGWISRDDEAGLIKRYGFYIFLLLVGAVVADILMVAFGVVEPSVAAS